MALVNRNDPAESWARGKGGTGRSVRLVDQELPPRLAGRRRNEPSDKVRARAHEEVGTIREHGLAHPVAVCARGGSVRGKVFSWLREIRRRPAWWSGRADLPDVFVAFDAARWSVAWSAENYGSSNPRPQFSAGDAAEGSIASNPGTLGRRRSDRSNFGKPLDCVLVVPAHGGFPCCEGLRGDVERAVLEASGVVRQHQVEVGDVDV
jgi:hypothetical protein